MRNSHRRLSGTAITSCVRDITSANKAPGGYGLGGEVADAPKDSEDWPDANLITATGFYRAFRNLPYGGWNYVTHLQYGTTNALQFSAYASGETYALREKIQNVWGDWDYINPAMRAGFEYRTTERYLGKPVYTMAFSFGALPNASDKEVAMPGTDGTCKIIEIHGYASNEMSLPGVSGLSEALQVTLTGIGNKAYIKTGADRSSATATIVAKYIKSTD